MLCRYVVTLQGVQFKGREHLYGCVAFEGVAFTSEPECSGEHGGCLLYPGGVHQSYTGVLVEPNGFAVESEAVYRVASVVAFYLEYLRGFCGSQFVGGQLAYFFEHFLHVGRKAVGTLEIDVCSDTIYVQAFCTVNLFFCKFYHNVTIEIDGLFFSADWISSSSMIEV